MNEPQFMRTAGESKCPICRRVWTVTPRADCLMPACGCYGNDSTAANPARPCENCGIQHALHCDRALTDAVEALLRHTGEALTVAQIHTRIAAQYTSDRRPPPSRVDVGIALASCRIRGTVDLVDASRHATIREYKAATS